MGLSSFFRRFRLFSRLDTAKADADDATTQPKTAVIIHHGNVPIDNQHIARATTKAEMQASASDQTQSYFFRLPLEIRRLVYRELWSDYFKARDVSPFSPGSDLRLHIYSDGFVTRSSRRNLCHLRCMVDHDASSRDDSEAVNPWPFDTGFRALPPLWFWFACIVRLHWGHHMQCQNAVMGHWDPFTGKTSEPDKSPFLPLFLACKKM
ncbi:hypothetical protein B0T17DRAFT_535635 [Bombardia bombarda]|uniref:Uncharacterized protein n=1 Tax=Bombardia bombarda TaxID=252184 RepID=A0AA39WUS5_9PEZI|nr:hypothetical protein B0T17DRAFT_535635 [Bombardia bombarda]